MSITGSADGNFSCPKCGGANTQSITIAYARSVRSSDSGYESVSAFGKSIAPPEQRDEKVGPTLIACLAAAACLVFLPGLFGRFDVAELSDLTLFSWPVVLGSCITGWAAGLIVAYPAIRYNVAVWPGEFAKWEAQMVCNRCFNTWPRDSIENRSGRWSSP